MQTTEHLKRRIRSAQDLLGVVRTMKALAATSIRQYQRAVESLAEYNRTVELGLQVVLRKSAELPRPADPRAAGLGILVFGTDQGLCGQFNNLIAEHALAAIGRTGVAPENRIVIAIGLRVADLLADAGQPVFEVLSPPGSTTGITPLVQDITVLLEDWRFRSQIGQMHLVYHEYLSGASYRAKTLQILPVEETWLTALRRRKWESATLPLFTMAWEDLFRALIGEYLFVSIYRAFANSLASENASRLAAMQSAEKNIEERLEELFMQFHRQRQMTITEELLDIVSGFEALGGTAQRAS
jgi:F-type H+-transporting ATPase subunit gamma